MGIYALQQGEEFLKKLIKKIEQCGEGSLVLLGDFNSIIDEDKD